MLLEFWRSFVGPCVECFGVAQLAGCCLDEASTGLRDSNYCTPGSAWHRDRHMATLLLYPHQAPRNETVSTLQMRLLAISFFVCVTLELKACNVIFTWSVSNWVLQMQSVQQSYVCLLSELKTVRFAVTDNYLKTISLLLYSCLSPLPEWYWPGRPQLFWGLGPIPAWQSLQLP